MGYNDQRRAILEQLIHHIPSDETWQRKICAHLSAKSISIGIHLAIFVEPYLSAVLDGKKTVESRFGVTRRPPYGCVDRDDMILLKQSGGPVIGLAIAQSAQFFKLSPSILANLRREYAEALFALEESFWLERADKKYATLIALKKPLAIEPMSVVKRDRQGWVTYGQRLAERDPESLPI